MFLLYETSGYGICHDRNFGGYIHIRSPFKRFRRKMLIATLCAFYAEESWFEENRIGAIHIFGVYGTDFSRSVLPF